MKGVLILGLVLVVILAAIGGIGWFFSNSILVPQPYALQPEFDIVAVGDGTVTLPQPPNQKQFAATTRTGTYGLVWESGSGVLGDITAQTAETVTRAFTVTAGSAPAPGAPARLDAFVYRGDPGDQGLAFETLALDGQAGELQAWWLPRDPETAVLLLHGRRRGSIQEGLRILPTLTGAGYSVLAIAYRNHGDSARSPDGFYHYGDSEWQDAVTALEFLKDRGVSRVVLYGFSMGGAVALETLKRVPAGLPEISALVLDSPLVDPRDVFRRGARDMGLPLADSLADWAMFVARLRAGIAWRSLDQRLSAATIRVPVLLIAGTLDSTVSIATVDVFAASVPDIEYRRLEGVEHVEGWNQMPTAYTDWVRDFLRERVPISQGALASLSMQRSKNVTFTGS